MTPHPPEIDKVVRWLGPADEADIRSAEHDLDRSGRRGRHRLAGILLIGVLLYVLAWAQMAGAAGTNTQSTYVWLQRSGVTLTSTTTPALACAVTTIDECKTCMAKMVASELASRTSGYVTYRCLDVSQSYLKFAKATNRAPTISGTPPATATVGKLYEFTPTASDPDGDTLTFALENRPPWGTFSTTTGKLSGTPTSTDVGVRSEIRIRVSDGKGGEASLAFGKLTTVAATSSVTLSWTAPTQNTDGSVLTNLAGYNILYGTSTDALTQAIKVPDAATTSYIVDNLSPATYYFGVKAYNSAGAESALSNVASKAVP